MIFKGLTILLLILLTALKIEASLSKDQRKTLLRLHREARAAVNASNMKELNWDDGLEKIAQNYADTCPGMKHSGTGPENIAARTSGTVTDLFNQFMAEKPAFDESNYREKFKSGSYNGKVVGHYSQIVWADNTQLGCGLADCSPVGFYKLFMVCRYGTGNIIGYEVYALKDPNSNSDDQEGNTENGEKEKVTSLTNTGYIGETRLYSGPSSSSSGRRSVATFGFYSSKYSLWFLSCILSYVLLNGILAL